MPFAQARKSCFSSQIERQRAGYDFPAKRRLTTRETGIRRLRPEDQASGPRLGYAAFARASRGGRIRPGRAWDVWLFARSRLLDDSARAARSFIRICLGAAKTPEGSPVVGRQVAPRSGRFETRIGTGLRWRDENNLRAQLIKKAALPASVGEVENVSSHIERIKGFFAATDSGKTQQKQRLNGINLEASPGIEPGCKDLQSSA